MAIANCHRELPRARTTSTTHAFVADHLQFKQGTENIGNATDDGYDASDVGQSRRQRARPSRSRNTPRASSPTPSSTPRSFPACRSRTSRSWPRVFAEPDTQASCRLWTMGVNQHNRGTWMNHNIYNIHLLSGKIAQPGDGTVLAHRPAHGLRHGPRGGHVLATACPPTCWWPTRSTAATPRPSGTCPNGYLDAIQKPGFHTVKIFRELSKGNIDFLWSRPQQLGRLDAQPHPLPRAAATRRASSTRSSA